MFVVGTAKIDAFMKRRTPARKAFPKWLQIVTLAEWTSFHDLKETFPSADIVTTDSATIVIFDVRGNAFRLIAEIDFDSRQLFVRHVFTHEEYDRWNERQ